MQPGSPGRGCCEQQMKIGHLPEYVRTAYNFLCLTQCNQKNQEQWLTFTGFQRSLLNSHG